MSIRSKLAGLAAGMTLAGGCLVFAPAAEAESMDSDPTATSAHTCNTGYYCVYSNANYGGSEYLFADNNPSWKAWAIDDNDSSSWNGGTSGMGVYLYRDINYRTPLGCLPDGRGWTQHRPNDSGSGNKWTRDC
ncbi:peptidase inhibitor family I36 protein [Streptomyces zagrosensis]|uniref:Peptidase inhibitor n=1 Tax=Streptomyces zagrosensis TaxID=1042984 RepID=A0A7W9QFZ8_9ACTN|nr:peptidase inhibitor family I36 protein [Streptomyces zagrosensis]MBB5939289.1 hypothetical protein [Streptomyces zagrosensis]